MACAFSHFRASAPSSLGMAGGSAVWCLPDLASGLEFLLRHLLIGYLGEISSYFFSSVKWGQLYSLELLNKMLYVNFPKVFKIYKIFLNNNNINNNGSKKQCIISACF